MFRRSPSHMGCGTGGYPRRPFDVEGGGSRSGWSGMPASSLSRQTVIPRPVRGIWASGAPTAMSAHATGPQSMGDGPNDVRGVHHVSLSPRTSAEVGTRLHDSTADEWDGQTRSGACLRLITRHIARCANRCPNTRLAVMKALCVADANGVPPFSACSTTTRCRPRHRENELVWRDQGLGILV